jgi:uncharacterized protein DUF4105
MGFGRWCLVAAEVLIGVGLTVWAVAALHFDFPNERMRGVLPLLYLVLLGTGIWSAKSGTRSLAVSIVGFLVVLGWWLTLRPSNTREWQPDVAQMPWAEIEGGRVTIHNLRKCTYRAEFDYTCEWKTRTVEVAKIDGVDLFITYWGSPWIAHPIVSFTVAGEEPVALSVETRKEVGETYSAVRGFFRYYELIYIVSDEQDVVRLRTNYRTGEDVYLFHTRATPQLAQAVFLDYLRRANALRAKPEWYNALTDNCTTNVAVHFRDVQGKVLPNFDWRVLLNGKADEMLYENGDLATAGLPFAELKARAHINDTARAASEPEFSTKVRQGRPGFGENPAQVGAK